MTAFKTILATLASQLFARDKFAQVRFVYFLGPTCVGKGYLMKLLMRWLRWATKLGILRVGTISFGDIIKDLLEKNADFHRAYYAMVKAGDLIPDPEAIVIFEREVDKLLRNGMPNLILVDGFCRSPRQIAFAVEHGYLREGDLVFMIEAEEGVCLQRFMHRCENKPDGRARVDAELPTFNKRIRDHEAVSPSLKAMFLDTDCTFIPVDGNKSIAEDVFPQIQEALESEVQAAHTAERYEPVAIAA